MWQDGIAVARVEGEIDLSNAEGVFSTLASAAQGARVVAVDLSAIAFIASAGIHALFELSRACSASGGEMCLIVPNGSPIRRVLLLTDVPKTIALYDSLPAAIEASRRPMRLT